MRRPNGYGSVICLDKSKKKRRKPYAVRITVEMTEDGKQRTQYLGYYESQEQAELALAQYHMLGLDVDANKLTFKNVFEEWLKDASSHMTDTNQKAYRSAFKLVSILHDKKFKDLKKTHLQTALDSVDRKHSTKKKIRSMMKQVWDYGVQNDYVMKNYATGLIIKEKQESVGKIFTDEEINLLWKHSDDYTVQMILVLIYTGLRINELLSLRKEKINLEEKYFVGGSKSKAGLDRTVPIHDAILPFIEESLSKSNYVLHKHDMSNITYGTFEDWFKEIMREFEMDHKIHDTRKTTVSLLHRYDVKMENIRFIVGHAQQGVTAKVYLKTNAQELLEDINQIPTIF